MKALSSNPRDTQPYQFNDTSLKKLETTKALKSTSTDSSVSASVFSGAASQPIFEQRCDTRQNTRQTFIDRGVSSHLQRQTSIESFIHHQQAATGTNEKRTPPDASSQGGAKERSPPFERGESLRFLDHTNPTNGVAERNLPEAVRRLDRRHAIPRPRHRNDVLIEIEASTVDKRDVMTRPGVRCEASLPIAVETTYLDCIGRVVQLTTHASAAHGISIDDRVAAIYPFVYKDEKSNNHQYALVDAALVVNVPKEVDAAMASCMTRLYTTAFQAIQLGLTDIHDRYDLNQLQGQSLLVQDGDTELGRVLIELAVELGASQIFATGPSGVHDRLRDMGATPLGAETFGWELFIEEKLSLVLIQRLPTPETFESFVSLLGQRKGMVYVQPPNIVNSQDDCGGNLVLNSFDNDNDTLADFFQDLSNKARGAIASTKFNCELECSNQFSTYEGVRESCKKDRILFRKDLRFLLTLLAEGKLNPQIEERVCLEDVPGVQDRIELEGKQGTIVCLPTTLFEKKANSVAAPKFKSKDIGTEKNSPISSQGNISSYAADSGYTKPNYDTLSDFNFLTPKPFEDESTVSPDPFLEHAASFTFAYPTKTGDSFLSFGNSFATWNGEYYFKNEAVPASHQHVERDVVEDLLQRFEKKERAKNRLKEKAKELEGIGGEAYEAVKVKEEKTNKVECQTMAKASLKKQERETKNHLSARAQAALQRKKEKRAKMLRIQQEKEKASQSNVEKADVEVEVRKVNEEVKEESQTTLPRTSTSSPRKSRREPRESFNTTINSTPAWKQAAANESSNESKVSCTHPTTRTPTPEWLKGVRHQSSTSSSSSSDHSKTCVNTNATVSKLTPEWFKETSAQTKLADYVSYKYRVPDPSVKTVSSPSLDGRDDVDEVSAASDFNSIMSKWRTIEKGTLS